MELKYYLFIFTFFFGLNFSRAQETKEKIEKQAQSFFKKGEFIEATPLFLRLLSLEPRNPNYNYKYGTCLLFNANKNEAFKYLNFAIETDSEVEPEAYFYLGKAYHLSYRFNKAIENYEIYKRKSKQKAISELQVDRQIEMCNNGKSLFCDITETIVLEKHKIGLKSFFRIYDLKNIGGSLIVNEEFQTKNDRKHNHTPLIHFPGNSDHIFYASYGEENDNKDIYYRTRLPDGSWSEQKPVKGAVNTTYNEDYPFMNSNGKHLYFSSEGHESMGGYDIFRSKYDPVSDSFEEPENMNIAISSPDNDFLYIVDSLENYAYFASQRESELNNIHVYKVSVQRLPLQLILIKGKFKSNIDPSRKKVSIQIENELGDLVGKYNSNTNGEYIIQLKKSGTYKFTLTVEGQEKSYSETIEIPVFKKFKPIQQYITEFKSEGRDSIVFHDLKTEEIEDPFEILFSAIEDKALMEINKDQYDLEALEQNISKKAKFNKYGLSVYSNLEIKELITDKHRTLNIRLQSTDSLIQKSKTSLKKKVAELKTAVYIADSLIELSHRNENSTQNQEGLLLVKRAVEKTESLQHKVEKIQKVLSHLENDSQKTKKVLEEARSLFNEIQSIEINNNEALSKLLSNHQDFIEKELLIETETNSHVAYHSFINSEQRKGILLANKKSQLLAQEISFEEEIHTLNKALSTTNNRDRETLSYDLRNTENLLHDVKNEIRFTDLQIQKSESIAIKKELLSQIHRIQFNNEFISTQELIDEFELLKNKAALLSSKEELTTKSSMSENDNTSVIESTKEILELQEKAKHSEGFTGDTIKVEPKTEAIKSDSLDSSTTPTLSTIDPKYESDTKQIQEGIKSGKLSRQELIKRKYKAVFKIQDALEKAKVTRKKNPNNESISLTIEALDQLENQLYSEISVLEDQIIEEIELEERLETEIKEDNLSEFKAENPGLTVNEIINKADQITLPHSIPNEVKTLLSLKDQENLNRLILEHERLAAEIEKNVTSTENNKLKKHQKELRKVEETIYRKVNNDLLTSISSNYTPLIKQTKKMAHNNSEDISILEAQQNMLKVELLLLKLDNQNEESKNYEILKAVFIAQENTLKLLEEAKQQAEIDNYISSALKNEVLLNIDAKSVAISQEDIINEQTKISLLLIHLESQINELNALIPSRNKKKKTTIENHIHQLYSLKISLQNKYSDNQKALITLQDQKIADENKGISEEAIKNTLSYKEEAEIAQSKAYIDQLQNTNKLSEAQYVLRIKESQLLKEQNELKQINTKIKSSNSFSDVDKKEISILLTKINSTKNEIEIARINVRNVQAAISASLPEDKDLRNKTENLIARDITPLTAETIKTFSQAHIKTGLVISKKDEITNANQRTIPMLDNTENLIKGLVFRVQIGAFKKPVPNSTFSEFSPITADNVSSGWIRYVVGIFNDQDNAKEARNKIRALGYSDAFVVAYCDGERIPVYRALQLMKSGACVPLNIENDEIKSENHSNQNNNTVDVDELEYNKAKGSANADVVETRKGLFYTVQVGVYNKPVSIEQLKNISPLITKRLPNGQLRYSSGIFNSSEEAQPKRAEAISRGITDAFIVAYYNGVGISVAQANEILKNNGESVLELNGSSRKIKNNKELTDNSEFVETLEPFINYGNTQSVLVSKKQFTEFPTQELNRYNEYGELFYYNPTSKQIQSFLFETLAPSTQFREEFENSALYNFAYPISDLKTPFKKEAIENSDISLIQIKVIIKVQDLNADLMDVILNAPVYKLMKSHKTKLEVDFYSLDIDSNSEIMDKIHAQLISLGAIEIKKTVHSGN